MPFGDWYMDFDYSNQVKEVVEPLINKNRKPICFTPNKDTYPLCIGIRYANSEICEDCYTCNLYENMKESEC